MRKKKLTVFEKKSFLKKKIKSLKKNSTVKHKGGEQKKRLTTIEMFYILYCKEASRYPVDPCCLLFSVYLLDNPLKSPFLLGFVYFSIGVLTRLPMTFYYTDYL